MNRYENFILNLKAKENFFFTNDKYSVSKEQLKKFNGDPEKKSPSKEERKNWRNQSKYIKK